MFSVKRFVHFLHALALVHIVESSSSVRSETTTASISQVHLAFAEDANAMRVSFSTGDRREEDVNVKYGETQKASCTTEHFRQWVNTSHELSPCKGCVNEYLHVCEMTDLVPGASYTYTIVASDANATFSFVAGRERTPYTFAVYGDMGTYVPEDGTGEASPTVKLLTNDVGASNIDGVLHVGDMAYDLADNGGQTATTFMNQIQPIASRVPYMVCPGNHEGGTTFAGDFKHFYRRFDMPLKQETQNNFYSFDVGTAHIISFSSEAYFWQYWNVERQYRWIERDLASVNRSKTPFIVTMAHRPMYCSNTDDHDDCTKVNSTMRRGLLAGKAHDGLFALEPLFKKYQVDLAFWAHEHTYERFFPMYENQVVNSTNDPSDPYHNPAATVHVVTGASGGREGHDGFGASGRTGSALRDIRYGYGRLTIANHTHLHWEEIEDNAGETIDSFWIRKD